MLKLKNFARERVWTLAALLISSLLVWFFGDAVSLYGRAFLEAPAKRFALILLLWLVFFRVINDDFVFPTTSQGSSFRNGF